MAITEEDRHRLRIKLEQVLGREEAIVLMEHLPPVGWADVATKRDLDQLEAATKRDLDQLQAATKRDLEQLQAATKRDLEHLAEVLRLEFRSELGERLTSLQRNLFFGFFTAQAAFAALIVGLS